MSDAMVVGICAVIGIFLSGGFLVLYGVYGGKRANLADAKVGEIYNFSYLQPVTDEPRRFLAKVMKVRSLTENEISKLNRRSKYRRYDSEFYRTPQLVTCRTMDGKVRNFYAQRTSDCRKPPLGPVLIRSKVAAIFL